MRGRERAARSESWTRQRWRNNYRDASSINQAQCPLPISFFLSVFLSPPRECILPASPPLTVPLRRRCCPFSLSLSVSLFLSLFLYLFPLLRFPPLSHVSCFVEQRVVSLLRSVPDRILQADSQTHKRFTYCHRRGNYVMRVS